MIPKLKDPAKHSVTPASGKPSTDTSVSPTTSDFTPLETPTKSLSSNHQSVEDINAAGMEETTESTGSKQQGKAPDSEGPKANEDASPLKPSSLKESTSTNPKAKRLTCKKHPKDSNKKKKKTKKHSKTVEADSNSDSDDSSSDSSSSSSSDDSSDFSSEEDEAAKKKRKSKAKKAKKLKLKAKKKAKAKAEDTDSDTDEDSSSSEEEKKKSKKKKQLKKKKRAKKSKEVEEEDEEEDEEDDDEDGDAVFNKQQLAQLQAMNLKRTARARVARGSSGETVSISGELGKKNVKAKGKPGKRSVPRYSPSTKSEKSKSQLLSLPKSIHIGRSPLDFGVLCAGHRGRHSRSGTSLRTTSYSPVWSADSLSD